MCTTLHRFNDPRCHAALNCASCHCPNLRREAYGPSAAQLSRQLDQQAAEWVGDGAKGVAVVVAAGACQATTAGRTAGNGQGGPADSAAAGLTLCVSQIFDWYGGDFAPHMLGFFQRFGSEEVRACLLSRRPGSAVGVAFREYDWGLTDRALCD